MCFLMLNFLLKMHFLWFRMTVTQLRQFALMIPRAEKNQNLPHVVETRAGLQSAKWYWRDISILKLSPGPSAKPFTPLRFLDLALLSACLNQIGGLLPRIVLQSARSPCACQPGFSPAGEELMTPTPVLSDTCFSPLSQSERAGNLGRHEINVGLRQRESQHNTRRRVAVSPRCQTERKKKRGKEHLDGKDLEIKVYPIWPGLETWPRRLSKLLLRILTVF